jgi:chemotaxis protein methyltransferase CheR
VNQEFAFSREEFGRVRQMIAAYAGISLHEEKTNMVYNRLARRLRATGAGSFGEYLDQVQAPGAEERERFVNALTTNLTAFLREPHHFERLAAMAATHKGSTLRVWSSACSTGEEAYSAAMVLREAGLSGEVLATDIDTEILAVAKRGVYPEGALARVGAERLRNHFLKGTGANAGSAMAGPELRAMVRFAPRNLLASEWPAGERFDVIFCRNVMIYFERTAQRRLLDRLASVLRPGGLLFLGHSESGATGHPAFQARGNTAYLRCTLEQGELASKRCSNQ